MPNPSMLAIIFLLWVGFGNCSISSTYVVIMEPIALYTMAEIQLGELALVIGLILKNAVFGKNPIFPIHFGPLDPKDTVS